MKTDQTADFGPLRSLFWPIYRSELRLVLPMIIMLFLTCFNYTILRNLKDVLVITAESSGGEVIPFIKFWAMLPMAILSAYVFTKLSNHFSQEHVYYMMVLGFLVAYAFFGFVVYPNRHHVELSSFALFLEGCLPAGCKGLIAMTRHWSFTAFYVLCELWSSIVLQVLFWGFANEVTKVKDASRFYSLFAVVASFSAIVAGYGGQYLTQFDFNPHLPFGHDAWEQTIQKVVLIAIAFGLMVLAAFWWLNKYVLTSRNYADLHKSTKPFKMKKKQSLTESFSFLMQSKYLLAVAVLVVSYNLVINLVEVVWKDQIKLLYPGGADYFIYLSNNTIYIGLLSTAASFFVGTMIRWGGWTFTALITPTIMLITSLGFFGFIFFNEMASETTTLFYGMTALQLAVFFGAAQNVLSKASKYAVFDATKEMAYIPLDHDVKLKGKAAIDGVGSRLGKSGGSVIHQGLLVMFSSLTASAPYIAAIIFVVIAGWFVAAKILGKEFALLARQRHDEAAGVTDQETPVTA